MLSCLYSLVPPRIRAKGLIVIFRQIVGGTFLVHIVWDYFVGMWLKVTGKGQGYVAVWYLTPYFGYFMLPPRLLVGVTPCPRKSQKNYTKEKDSNK